VVAVSLKKNRRQEAGDNEVLTIGIGRSRPLSAHCQRGYDE